jgi:D-hydroxyproline dehydrogenase subunit beta
VVKSTYAAVMNSQRVAIVGAGIVGLAHAWSASERGHQVMLFDRTRQAQGASIRNFGMVFPLSQPDSMMTAALHSRHRWLELSRDAGVWLDQCGSLLLAHRQDEWDVLEEFYQLHTAGDLQPHLRLLKPEDCRRLSPAVRTEGLIGGLSCDLELRVDPTTAIDQIAGWLQERHGVQLYWGSSVTEVDARGLRIASGQRFEADRIVVCPGSDLESLYPDLLSQQPLTKCKLQMMRTVPQPAQWRLGPHLSSGLTLRHYTPFSRCVKQEPLIQRIAAETPELDRYGIHVLVSQDSRGRLILGDSHQYGPDLDPFHSEKIDQLILRELRRLAEFPSWEIESRWSGVYAKNEGSTKNGSSENGSSENLFSPEPGVFVCTGLGGSGMTLAFGLAEAIWNQWEHGSVSDRKDSP